MNEILKQIGCAMLVMGGVWLCTYDVHGEEVSAIEVSGTLLIDSSKNFQGGVSTNGGSFRHLLDVGVEIDFGKIVDEKVGVLFVSFQTHEGEDGSGDTGDIQAYSNIDEGDFTALYELWYEQWIVADRVRVKVGKVDANSEFAFVEYGGGFIHSSAGFSPAVFVLPTYPDPAMSVNLFVYPTDDTYVSVGYYDGSAQEGVKVGRRGPATFFKSPGDAFMIAEVGVSWDEVGGERLNGRVGIGGWRHSGHFVKFNGGIDKETQGGYIVFDQQLFRVGEDDDRGVGLFAQFGFADETVSEVHRHYGVGVEWKGMLGGRDDDSVGVMMSYAELSDLGGAGFRDEYELAVECFYRLQVTERVVIQPDVQFIVNPGGGGLSDVVVGTVRVEISF